MADLATQQYGVVSRDQLVALGFGEDAIARGVRRGRWHRVHPSVYAVGHPVLGANGRRLAAVLSVPSLALAFRSAMDFWGVRPYGGTPELIVAGYSGIRRRTGVVVHRTAYLVPADVTVVDGIRVTTLARTLLDASAVVRDGIGTMITRAEQADLFDLAAIEAAIERAPGHRGVRPLRAAVAELHPESSWTKLDLELAMLELCQTRGLPGPVCNGMAQGFEVDFLWEDARVIVETDSWQFHKTRRAFQRDRTRDRALVLAGYRVLRFTHADVDRHGEQVADELRRALAP